MVVPEREDIETIMREWERALDQLGWGMPPTLAMIAGRSLPDGSTELVTFFTPVQPEEMHLHAPTALSKLADAFEKPAPTERGAWTDPVMQDQLAGLIFTWESGRMRVALGVDCGGRTHWLSRERDNPQLRFDLMTVDNWDHRYAGTLTFQLLRLLLALLRGAPGDSADREELRALMELAYRP